MEPVEERLLQISIIMPAYNEGARIHKNIVETVRTMQKMGYDFELIVVDDGSQDNTYQEAQKSKAKFQNVMAVRYANNRGKGDALKYGFKYVSGDIVVFLDADLDIHPRQIETLLNYMRRYNTDVVIGSKRHRLSQLDYPLQRVMLSNAYAILIKSLFDLSVRDTQAGLKLFRRKVLDDVFPRMLVKRYAYDLEMLVNVHKRGYKIVEAPITLNFQRKFGRVGLRDIGMIALDTAAIFYRLKILKYYDKDCNNEIDICRNSNSSDKGE
jgi:glycosyltransferase involved in cell wall biosynthesis